LNVREKRSLCYYCLSSVSMLKGTLTVDCGVQTADLAEAEAAIHEQIDILRRGDFPDSMMQEALLDYRRRAAMTGNSNASVAARIADSHMFGDERSPEEIAAALEQITVPQIRSAAERLTPDTVYILRAEEAISY